MSELPITDYFRDNVLVKRPYIQRDWCEAAVRDPIRKEVQADDGRLSREDQLRCSNRFPLHPSQ
jgi:hypothetical protein